MRLIHQSANFTYLHLKPSLFFGYQLDEWNDHQYAMDEPEALIDYLDLHP